MSQVDVHILTMPESNPTWLQQCLQSLQTEPVKVYIRPGIRNNIGNARADAFLFGDSEYVSFVDPDDYVLPGGFAECIAAIKESKASAAYTYEIKTGISGEVLAKPYVLDWAHHLIVFRREVVIDNLDFWRSWAWPSKLSEGRLFVDWLKQTHQGVCCIKKPYYVWRRHTDSYTVKYQKGVKNG